MEEMRPQAWVGQRKHKVCKENFSIWDNGTLSWLKEVQCWAKTKPRLDRRSQMFGWIKVWIHQRKHSIGEIGYRFCRTSLELGVRTNGMDRRNPR